MVSTRVSRQSCHDAISLEVARDAQMTCRLNKLRRSYLIWDWLYLHIFFDLIVCIINKTIARPEELDRVKT